MINVSIVLYHTKTSEVKSVVRMLRKCSEIDDIWLIDNSETPTKELETLNAIYIFNNKNIGYGRAHNIALKKSLTSGAKYHIVMNSDIIFERETITTLLNFMENNKDVGHCMPLVRYPNGDIQYLAKKLPTPFDLFARRFLPKAITKKRTKVFENHDFYKDINKNPTKTLNAPYLSGCFMFLRCDALKKVGLFDPRYFMYPEDIDLTRRIHKYYKTVLYPATEIVHNHAQSSYHSWKMLWIHISNMCKYFNKWGWITDPDRNN